MALGHLVMSCGNLVFIDLIEHLLTELGRNDNMSTTRTYIQCTAAISRQAGHRIGETGQEDSMSSRIWQRQTKFVLSPLTFCL